MKFLTLAATIALSSTALSSITNAGTVETANPTTSQIKINGVNFEFRVHDNGLQTSGTIFPKPAKFESTRVLVLEYQAQSSVPASMRTDLFADVRSKCQEFGDTELANQSKGVAKNFVVRGNAELGSSQLDEATPPTWGRFVCRANVTAEETSK